MAVAIDAIWHRIREHGGETFHTKRGLPFTYDATHDALKHTRTEMPVAKEAFAIVLAHVPLDGPGDVPRHVMGPSYVWAILHDHRIRSDDY